MQIFCKNNENLFLIHKGKNHKANKAQSSQFTTHVGKISSQTFKNVTRKMKASSNKNVTNSSQRCNNTKLHSSTFIKSTTNRERSNKINRQTPTPLGSWNLIHQSQRSKNILCHDIRLHWQHINWKCLQHHLKFCLEYKFQDWRKFIHGFNQG